MRVRSKEPFITKAHRFIVKKAGVELNLPKEDYDEVKDKVELIKGEKEPKAHKAMLQPKHAKAEDNSD